MRRIIAAVVILVIAWLVWGSLGDRLVQDDPEFLAGQRTVLHRGNGTEPESLDPHRMRSDSALTIGRDIYEGLTALAPDNSVIPGVASSWDISDDGLKYTFHLRDDARWSNDDRVTAADFVFAFRRLVDPDTGGVYAFIISPIKNAPAITAGNAAIDTLGVTALDELTLAIELETPAPYLLGVLGQPSTSPLHRPTLASHGDRFARPENHISNGPYVLTEVVVGSHVRARRNPYFHGSDEVSIEEVVYHTIPDPATELTRYRAGELDMTYTSPSAQFSWVTENLGDELHVSPQLSTYYYGFNLEYPALGDNPGLRQALSMVIDRQILTDSVLGAGQHPASSWVPPGVNNYQPSEFGFLVLSKDQRIERAQVLYAAAGYSEDNPLRLEILYNTGEGHRNIALAVTSMWQESLGAEITVINKEFRVLLQDMRDGNTQVFRSSWVGDYNDANTFAEVFLSDSGANFARYSNSEYDNLVAQAGRETNVQKRRELLQSAETILLNDAPVIPLYYYTTKRLSKPYVKGWVDNIMNFQLTRYLSMDSD